MSERYYGEYYAPGDEWEETENLRRQFRKDLKELPIEIVGYLDITYLNKYDRNREDEAETADEQLYQAGLAELEDVAMD